MPRKAKPSDEKYILSELDKLSERMKILTDFCGTTADYAAKADKSREVIFEKVHLIESQLMQMRKLMDWIVADKLK